MARTHTPCNRPTNQPTDRPTNRPTDRPTDQPAGMILQYGIAIHICVMYYYGTRVHTRRTAHECAWMGACMSAWLSAWMGVRMLYWRVHAFTNMNVRKCELVYLRVGRWAHFALECTTGLLLPPSNVWHTKGLCIALHCMNFYCIALHCIALHCIALHCVALHCIALHCIALHCIALQCTRAVAPSTHSFFTPPPPACPHTRIHT